MEEHVLIKYVTKDYLNLLLLFVSCLSGAGLSFLFVTKVRVPLIEGQMKKLGLTVEDLQRKLNNADFSQYVLKRELYEPSGKLIYMARDECLRERNSCQLDTSEDRKKASQDFSQLQILLKSVVQNQIDSRTMLISFMSAVKEKMDLKFSVPEK